MQTVPKIGGTKNPRISEIIALKPDLVIANHEENLKAHIQRLEKAGYGRQRALPRRITTSLIFATDCAASACGSLTHAR